MKYFGTDGTRAIFDDNFLLLAYKIGFVLGSKDNSILIATDTRESGKLVADAFISGAKKNLSSVTYSGIMPTPALSVATRKGTFDFGVMITASHNPKEYNGIKIFDRNGYKLSDDCLAEIEKKIDESPVGEIFPGEKESALPLSVYFESLKNIPRPVKPLKILVDCAAGATVKTVGMFEQFASELVLTGTDGFINDGSGVFFVEQAKEKKKQTNADLAFVFDGDGDRVICIDENDEIINGDVILYILSKYLLRQGRLKSKTVVGTVYSSVALERSLNVLGVSLVRTAVGDKYVSETMRKYRLPLGAESSGHVILNTTTGDGLRTALLLTYLASIIPLNERKSGFMSGFVVEKTYPFDYNLYTKLKNDSEKYKSFLGKNGRIIIRKSGTEPIIRVLAESDEEKKIDEVLSSIEKTIKKC